MSQRQTGRIILAVVAGYAANAILVVATEQLLLPLIRDGRPPLYYFVADLISRMLLHRGWRLLCCLIARPSRRVDMVSLIGLGIVVGTISVVTLWRTEPHWYALALLAAIRHVY
jgi:hypothetical protein